VAASFSEMARRLNPDAASRGFLCAADARFSSAMMRLSPAQSPSDAAAFAREVLAACEPLNIAGLCDASKHNAYDVDLEDTVRGASKLGLSSDRVREALAMIVAAGL
jgi:hypothetical protein